MLCYYLLFYPHFSYLFSARFGEHNFLGVLTLIVTLTLLFPK